MAVKRFNEIVEIVARCEAPYRALLVKLDDDRPYLQVLGVEPDWTAPVETRDQVADVVGRKWFLSPHMTESEIVRTAFAALLAFEEHELRERFRYNGRAIFGPHISVTALVEIAERLDKRADHE